MIKLEIQMFYTYVFYIEGNPEQLDHQFKSIQKEYGLIKKKGDTTTGIEKSNNGKVIFLQKDENSTIDTESIIRASVIVFNTESTATSHKSIDQRKVKIGTICHEIRHVVDQIVGMHNINDVETPAYLTGWLSREILSTVMEKGD